MSLNPQQELVREHYQGGEFAYIETLAQVHKCGDGLFVFLMHEAHDAEDMAEFDSMLDTAIRQLRSLQGEIRYE